MIILKILQKINKKYQKVKLPMTNKDTIKKYLIFKLVMNVNMFCWKFWLFIFFDNLFKHFSNVYYNKRTKNTLFYFIINNI